MFINFNLEPYKFLKKIFKSYYNNSNIKYIYKYSLIGVGVTYSTQNILKFDRKNLIIWHDTYEKRNALITIVYLKSLIAVMYIYNGFNLQTNHNFEFYFIEIFNLLFIN